MRTLVTGSNGFIGTAVVERLLAHGHRNVRCLVREGSERRKLERVVRGRADAAKIVSGHLATVEAAQKAVGDADQIVHLAASLRGAPAEVFAGTVVTSKNLLEAALSRPRPPKIILVSSFSVYGVAELPKDAVVDEGTPMEPHPERRDSYALAKHWQEKLFWAAADRLPLVVLRPGAVYGPGGPSLSSRVGLRMAGVFLHLGGDNLLPLTYVDNCAEAIAISLDSEDAVGRAFNVVDDDLPTSRAYLHRYEREAERLRLLRVPLPLLRAGSWLVEKYHHASQGQLPAIFTPYKVASTWKPQRFDNRRLKELGWRQLVSTEEGMTRCFAAVRGEDTGERSQPPAPAKSALTNRAAA